MSYRSAAKKTAAVCRRLSQELERPWLPLYLDALCCSLRHGASPENYAVLRFYDLPERERARYLTSGRSRKLDRELNRSARPEELAYLMRKHLFNRFFHPWIRREWLYLPEASPEALRSFLLRHDRIVLKPDGGIMGRGLEIAETAALDPDRLFRRGACEALLAEERIEQHPSLAEIHAASVNSVRVNSARDRAGRTVLIGACLKAGTGEGRADNFHAGGIAWPLDPETGCVCRSGRDRFGTADYPCHPDTGFPMRGFAVPFWPEILDCVRDCMARIPSVGYVGWDLAVTEGGPEMIEGNVRWPGGNIIQFDGEGKYPLLKSCSR